MSQFCLAIVKTFNSGITLKSGIATKAYDLDTGGGKINKSKTAEFPEYALIK